MSAWAARTVIAAATATALLTSVAATAAAREGSRFRPAVSGPNGVVATESLPATLAARSVLDRGGNAVDAAATAALAMGSTRPQSCGLGGGGFLVYRSAGGREATIDFRETAPRAITPDAFQGEGPFRTFTGYKTVGVPGTLAGLEAALERFGTLSLSQALAPAERLAAQGVPVTPSLAQDLAANASRLAPFPASSRIFLQGGAGPLPAGAVLRQPELARSIALIRRRGSRAFYDGPIAEGIVRDVRQNGSRLAGDQGLLTRADLRAYRARVRPALTGSYRGRRIVTAPPPTSGGVAALEILNLLEGFDMRGFGMSSADSLHVIAEAQKIAFADRGAYVADPGFARVPTIALTSKAYAARRRGEIDLGRARDYSPGDVTAGAARAAGADLNPRASTTHVSVVDQTGNAVALTCTIEQSFGSGVVAPGTGILLNNELTDFSGPGTANEARPGKRPRSSISPTIVVEGNRPRLAVGGAGGVRIIMGSLLAVVNTVDYRLDLARAVDAERLDEPSLAAGMTLEDARVDDGVEAELLRRGHVIRPSGEYDMRPRVQAAGVGLRPRLRLGISDPRTDMAARAALRGRDRTRDAGSRFGRDQVVPRVRFTAVRRVGRAVSLQWRGRDRGGVAFFTVQARRRGPTTEGAVTSRTTERPSARFRTPRRGRYAFRVRAVDRAGNVSRFDTVNVTVR